MEKSRFPLLLLFVKVFGELFFNISMDKLASGTSVDSPLPIIYRRIYIYIYMPLFGNYVMIQKEKKCLQKCVLDLNVASISALTFFNFSKEVKITTLHCPSRHVRTCAVYISDSKNVLLFRDTPIHSQLYLAIFLRYLLPLGNTSSFLRYFLFPWYTSIFLR
jgi:hypothetical protein